MRRLGMPLEEARVAVRGLWQRGLGGGQDVCGERRAFGVRAGPHRHHPQRQAGLDMARLLDHVAQHRGVVGFPAPTSSTTKLLGRAERRAHPGRVGGARSVPNAPAPAHPPGGGRRQWPHHARRRGRAGERGIPVVPDVIANAGGVTVSYFEWVQDFSSLLLDRGRDQCAARQDPGRRLQGHLGDQRQHRIQLAHGGLHGGLRAGAAGAEERGLYP